MKQKEYILLKGYIDDRLYEIEKHIDFIEGSIDNAEDMLLFVTNKIELLETEHIKEIVKFGTGRFAKMLSDRLGREVKCYLGVTAEKYYALFVEVIISDDRGVFRKSIDEFIRMVVDHRARYRLFGYSLGKA